MFRRIGLILNPDRPEAVAAAREAQAFLEEHQISCFYLQEQLLLHQNPDLILTFGGDGTFLIGAHYAMDYDIPLMGINLGNMGFLTETEPARLTESLEAILDGRFDIEKRFLLEIHVSGKEESFHALNDAVITRGGFARLIQVACCVDGEEYGVFTADGMIAATPTGSTGYSLSAGGPIVHPSMDCMILTPVCAHSLQRCPCVVSGTSDITIRLDPERRQTAELQIDGMDRGKLNAGDTVSITGSDKTVRLLRIHPFHFFPLLQSKLIEWGSSHL